MDRQPKTTAFLFALAAPALVLAAVPETPVAPAGPAAPGPAEPGASPVALDAQRGEAERERLYDELAREPRETAVSRIVRTVTPAVVFVETEAYQRVRTILGTRQRLATGAGSGVVIHPSGLIVTNYHVVEGAQNIRVSFEGEPESYVAELMSFVREEDLALLKIRPDEGRAAADPVERKAGGLRTADAPREFPTVRLGTSADLMPGERVVAIGSPHGQAYTVSTGIISGLHRDVTVPNRNLSFRGLIQTDASINLGNSGGPLLNIRGELIGINTVMNSAAENIGFAIPVDRVSQVLDEVLFPNARTIWLGFDVKEIGSKLIVTEVWQGGPAEHLNACEGY